MADYRRTGPARRMVGDLTEREIIWLLNAGLRQRQVAALCGIDQSKVSKINKRRKQRDTFEVQLELDLE